jgi:uncharacterized membrane protein
VVGIIANYAAVAADTFSSELGILSKSHPRLITSFTLRPVPPGTNGGVTIWGLAAGLLGSFIIVATSMLLTPFCTPAPSLIGLSDKGSWSVQQRVLFALALTIWGALGSVLDSLLGGWFQQSVVDTRTGRIIEGEGGKNVLISNDSENSKKATNVKGKPSRVVENGTLALLDNNQVNFLMALIMSLGAMGVASRVWDAPIGSIVFY